MRGVGGAVYVYTFMHTFVCIYIYVHMYINIHMFTHIQVKILVDHKEDLTQPVVYAINAPQAMRQRGSNFCVQRSTCPCLNASCLSPFLGWFDSLCWNCAWIARLELSFQPGAIQQQTGSDLQALHAELFPGLCKGLTYTSAAHDFFTPP